MPRTDRSGVRLDSVLHTRSAYTLIDARGIAQRSPDSPTPRCISKLFANSYVLCARDRHVSSCDCRRGSPGTSVALPALTDRRTPCGILRTRTFQPVQIAAGPKRHRAWLTTAPRPASGTRLYGCIVIVGFPPETCTRRALLPGSRSAFVSSRHHGALGRVAFQVLAERPSRKRRGRME